MYQWQLNAANETPFVMVDENNAELTGLTVTVQIQKPGTAAFGAAAGSVTEIGSGWYKYTSTTGEADTEGNGALKATATGAVQQNLPFQVGAKPVWSSAVRTLTQSGAEVIAAVAGSTLSRYQGTTWRISLTGLGDLTPYTASGGDLYFTLKGATTDTDNKALIWLSANAGLLRCNKAAPAAVGNGVFTVLDEDAGDVYIEIEAIETAKLTPRSSLDYDIKGVRPDGDVDLISDGRQKFTIEAVVTAAVTAQS